MASLDKMEGDLIEGAVIVALVVFGVAAWMVYKQFGKLDLVAAAKQALALISNAWANATNAKGSMALKDWSSSGNAWANSGGSGWSGDDEARYQSELLNAFNDGQMTLDQYQSFAAPVGGN